MSNRNGNDLVLLVVILGGGFILFCVWQFSNAFGLDMSTGSKVMALLAIPIALGITSFKFFDGDYDMLRLGSVWPVLIGLVWVAFWPALDHWAAHGGYRPSLYDEDVTVWWNAWYTEFGALVALIGGAYGAKKLFNDYV
ncbi:hypothetical protein NK8_81830 (plasmid) [Caballeronia sp. NK8]|uniref:hypothetical protein n=1 Tax=Caballeronia sp. NK8 TaxID=140098 RepID=UPI001BB51B15|nr:hypothetical protein [Caballeronia sp. NK8]BCQ29992.1 hypothetical protein NK8_81830 [Caballeronia sp. NK8]